MCMQVQLTHSAFSRSWLPGCDVEGEREERGKGGGGRGAGERRGERKEGRGRRKGGRRGGGRCIDLHHAKAAR